MSIGERTWKTDNNKIVDVKELLNHLLILKSFFVNQTVQQCMVDQRTLMRNVLEDSRLVSLQREGGAILARLRKESDLKYPHYEDLR